MTALSEIMALVPKLSKSDLDLLIAKLKPLAQLGGSAVSSDAIAAQSSDAKLIVSLICKLLENNGLVCYPSMLERSAAYSAFLRKVDGVMAYIRSAAKTRVQQVALLQIGLELVYRLNIQQQITVSGTTLLNHIHRVPAALEVAFPGYAAAGLLEKVLTRKEETNAQNHK